MTEPQKSLIRTFAAVASVIIQIAGLLILVHFRPR